MKICSLPKGSYRHQLSYFQEYLHLKDTKSFQSKEIRVTPGIATGDNIACLMFVPGNDPTSKCEARQPMSFLWPWSEQPVPGSRQLRANKSESERKNEGGLVFARPQLPRAWNRLWSESYCGGFDRFLFPVPMFMRNELFWPLQSF